MWRMLDFARHYQLPFTWRDYARPNAPSAGAMVAGQLVAWNNGSYAASGATITLVYLLGMGLIWLAPETKGKPLPE